MSIDLAVVPVAGRGTRLLPLTKSQPKEMLAVGRSPVVQYVAEELHRCDIHRLIFVTGPGKAAIENHFDTDNELDRSTYERREKKKFCRIFRSSGKTSNSSTRGSGSNWASAMRYFAPNRSSANQNFVVALGDSILGVSAQSQVVRTMAEQFEKQQGVEAVIAFEAGKASGGGESTTELRQPKGKVDEVFELADLVEKPSIEEAPSQLAVAARYVFSSKIFDCLERTPTGQE